jgi:protein associated with RNAse G/E
VSKYKSKKVIVDGIEFDSKLESQYYIHLKALQQRGEIEYFERQPRFVLQDAFTKNGKKYRAIEYVADFMIVKDGKVTVVDVKGYETADFKIKKKLFEYRFPEYELVLMKYVKKYGGWISVEEWKRLKRGGKS